eukprot:scaffold1100_cov323-Prasinococcus_capsulatus_cf.AAC.3
MASGAPAEPSPAAPARSSRRTPAARPRRPPAAAPRAWSCSPPPAAPPPARANPASHTSEPTPQASHPSRAQGTPPLKDGATRVVHHPPRWAYRRRRLLTRLGHALAHRRELVADARAAGGRLQRQPPRRGRQGPRRAASARSAARKHYHAGRAAVADADEGRSAGGGGEPGPQSRARAAAVQRPHACTPLGGHGCDGDGDGDSPLRCASRERPHDVAATRRTRQAPCTRAGGAAARGRG